MPHLIQVPSSSARWYTVESKIHTKLLCIHESFQKTARSQRLLLNTWLIWEGAGIYWIFHVLEKQWECNSKNPATVVEKHGFEPWLCYLEPVWHSVTKSDLQFPNVYNGGNNGYPTHLMWEDKIWCMWKCFVPKILSCLFLRNT